MNNVQRVIDKLTLAAAFEAATEVAEQDFYREHDNGSFTSTVAERKEWVEIRAAALVKALIAFTKSDKVIAFSGE